jgi:hypothetical protein
LQQKQSAEAINLIYQRSTIMTSASEQQIREAHRLRVLDLRTTVSCGTEEEMKAAAELEALEAESEMNVDPEGDADEDDKNAYRRPDALQTRAYGVSYDESSARPKQRRAQDEACPWK